MYMHARYISYILTFASNELNITEKLICVAKVLMELKCLFKLGYVRILVYLWQYAYCCTWFAIPNDVVESLYHQNIPNESVKGILNEVDNLTEEKIDQLLHEFLQSFKEGSLEANDWPQYMVAYSLKSSNERAHTDSGKEIPKFSN